MTDGEGKVIRRVIEQVRELHRSVSLLIRTAESAMNEAGWQNGGSGSYALHEFSYSIDRPDKWMPWEVFRFFKHPDHPTKWASIAVLLDDAEGRLAEPVVTGALFEFPTAEAVGFQNWFASIYKAIPGREADGQIHEAARAELSQDWQSSFDRVWCLALPLVDINSEDDLREKIVGRLLSAG
ncbi:MAG: hypothetical protein ACFCUT_04450 [Kiloniellaceae bacterium]